MTILIGLHGKARSGKDTVGLYLEAKYNTTTYAFADPVKKACSIIFGIPITEFYKGDRSFVDPYWGLSLREMMQLMGTDAGRCTFGDDIWIKAAHKEWEYYKKCNTWGTFVVTDVRFTDEAEWVREQGGQVWYIKRYDAESTEVGIKGHASEAGIDILTEDAIIDNNGSLEELYRQVDSLWLDIPS